MFLVLVEAQFFQSVLEASFAFGFLKISIALSLLRLSRGKWYKRGLWSLIGRAFNCQKPYLLPIDTFLAQSMLIRE